MNTWLNPNMPENAGVPELITRITDRIVQEGPITFAEYMSMALYDPDYGYYTSGRKTVGTYGDFITSASLGPAFGAMIAEWIAGRYAEMGCPHGFEVVEIGAGKGVLCASIMVHLRDSHAALYDSITYRIIETLILRDALAPFGQPLTEEFPGKILMSDSLDDIEDGSITGCFISNELPDAFPVHLVSTVDGALHEIYITLDGDEFVEVAGELSSPTIADYFRDLGINLPDGYRTEVNLEAVEWIRKTAGKMKEGFILTIDYGYTAEEYYSLERRTGTLVCYNRHTYNEDPYARIGLQDITAHVDFTSLVCAGASAGLTATAFTSQREFLVSQGIHAHLRAKPAQRRVAQALVEPDGLGGFKVLILRK
ncbi:MAG: class I SAM-dependent methyltransferase [Armatimonadota bacterium]